MMNKITWLLLLLIFPLSLISQTSISDQTEKGKPSDAFNKLMIMGREGKYDSVIIIGSQLLNEQPNYTGLLKIRGLAYLQLTDYLSAYKDFSSATSLSPDSSDYWFLQAFAAEKAELTTEAKMSIERSLLLNDKKAQSWYIKGNLLTKEDKLDEALNCYNRAIGLQKGYADALAMKGYILYRRRENPIAIETLQLAIAADNQFSLPYFYIGLCYLEDEKPSDALKSFDNAMRLGYNEGDLYHYRGLAMLQLRRFDDACDMWKEAVLRGYTLSKAMSKRYCRH